MKTRNNLEEFCWEQLDREGIAFEYERSIELFPPFQFKGISIEKRNKNLKIKNNKYQDIVYSPDFSGKNWVIETKGLRRPSFDLRWKIFKYMIRSKGWLLLMPTNQKEVLICIAILKQWLKNDREWSDSRILQIAESIQQPAKKRAKPKGTKAKEG